MKKIILSAVVGALLAVSASAQESRVYTLGGYNGGTNNFATATTNTITGAAIAVSEVDNVGVQLTFKGTGSGTDTIVFKFALSLDGTTYETTPSTTVTQALAGTAVVSKVANISVPSAGAIKLVSVENPASVGVTNVFIKVRVKHPSVRSR
jgi:hypothetical protein